MENTSGHVYHVTHASGTHVLDRPLKGSKYVTLKSRAASCIPSYLAGAQPLKRGCQNHKMRSICVVQVCWVKGLHTDVALLMEQPL